jgi:hypothetical protein
MGVAEESKRRAAAERTDAMAELRPTVERAVRLIVGAGSAFAEDAVQEALIAIDRDRTQVRGHERAWALLVAGSAVAAQRAVLEPFGVFVSSDSRYGNVGDRDFIREMNAGGTPALPAIARAGLVLQSAEASGDVRVYATVNVDGSSGVAISEDGNPAGYGCCRPAADPPALHVGAQLSHSLVPVAYPDTWAGWTGAGTSAVSLLYSDGSTGPAVSGGGYFLAIDHAPRGEHPVALVARAADGSELDRIAISRG